MSQFTQMTDMIIKGRADVMLAGFYNSDDLSFTQDGHKFMPINGFKVSLPDSRHFVVSRGQAQNKAIFAMLEKGLAVLRKKGLIEKAYKQSGFINEQVQHWAMTR